MLKQVFVVNRYLFDKWGLSPFVSRGSSLRLAGFFISPLFSTLLGAFGGSKSPDTVSYGS